MPFATLCNSHDIARLNINGRTSPGAPAAAPPSHRAGVPAASSYERSAEPAEDEDGRASQERRQRAVASRGGVRSPRAQHDGWDGCSRSGRARRGSAPDRVPCLGAAAVRAGSRMRRPSRPRRVDAGAERDARGGAFVGGCAFPGPPGLVQGQRILPGRRRARIGVHAGFQAGGGLDRDCRAAQDKRREGSSHGRIDDTHPVKIAVWSNSWQHTDQLIVSPM